MGASKGYFSQQFRLEKFTLQHEDASDFYLSCWQKNRCTLPLFLVRLFLFLGCLSIVVASLVLAGQSDTLPYWLIYMTHWGIMIITVASGMACAVSARAYFGGPIESTFALPWFVKLYWVAYNITIPVALFITVFYYLFLFSMVSDGAPILDLFVHGINSAIMFLLVMTSRHPTHLLHFWHPLLFMILYLVFSIIYYYAGGLNMFGETTIYPMLDWSNPGPTVLVVLGSAVGIIVLHMVVVLISLLRDGIARCCVQKSIIIEISE